METPLEHFDVLIVGAGLSGIGAAVHLQNNCPGRGYAILEARECIGGTWDLFRYPGIRSDSDMYTLGYSFKPWKEAKAIADGDSILNYIEQTAHEHRIDERIRFDHRVVRSEWSSSEARWTVEVERVDTGETVHLTCGFLLMCSGYYRYDEGYTPEFAGTERFAGQIVHPQHWPEEIDYAGKRVVVIGSGATAITLVPAMASSAAHVTMLQRSPSYVVSLPAEDRIANSLRRRLPAKLAYAIARWKNVLRTMASFQLARRWPAAMKSLLRKALERAAAARVRHRHPLQTPLRPLGPAPVPGPDGDLFKAISSGRAEVVTDRIETFTERGIRLASGEELQADLVVTATGLNLMIFGGMEIAVDGREVDLGQTMSYKGMLLSDVPNLALTVGYTNASWTLKCDLTCEYVCRLLNHMAAHGYDVCTARRDPTVPELPFIDFSSGYVVRTIGQFPKQGAKAPWRLYQNYALDILSLKRGAIEDDVLELSRAPSGAVEPVAPVAA